MAVETPTKPVREEPISKVNDEIEVGADLEFQKRWWRFENIVWWVFTCIIVLDVIGAFGHGWLAGAEMKSRDGSVDVKYDRIEPKQPGIYQIILRVAGSEQMTANIVVMP